MKRNSFFVLCLLFSASYSIAQIQQAWVNRYSLDSSRTNQATAMALSPDGNVIVAGSSASTNGDLDYLIVKYASNGQQLWLARYDSPTNGADQLRGMALDTNGNIIATGTSKTVKFSSGGAPLWAAPYGGRAVATDTNGNAYVTGFSELDYATVKLDPNGTNLWLRTFSYITDTTNVPDISQVIAVGTNGTVVVSGYETHSLFLPSGFTDKWIRIIVYDALGNQIWSVNSTSHIGGYWEQAGAVAVDSNGRVLTVHNVGGIVGPWTSKYDESGYLLWKWIPGLDDNSGVGGFGQALALDVVGNVYLTCLAGSNRAMTTVKLSPDGNKIWRSSYVGPVGGLNQGTAIALDPAGNVYVTGYSPGNGSGNDIVTLKYDNNGNQIWVQRYNGPANGDDIPTAIAVDSQGSVYVTGYSATTNGGTEFVTIKYAELQNIQKKSDGSMQLQFFGTPGQTSAFYGGTNLSNWDALGSSVAGTNGIVQFTDTNAPSFPCRFYRRYSLP